MKENGEYNGVMADQNTGTEKKRKLLKRISISALCIAAAVTFFLIPINIFCVNFPEWVTVLLSALFCGGLAAYLLFFNTKLVTKIMLPIIFGVIAMISSLIPYLVPYWNSYVFKEYHGVKLNYDELITDKAAEEDFDALKKHLERTHPMFMSGLTEEVENAFTSSLQRLKNADKITVNDFRREIQSVLHLMGDAHTSTYNGSYPSDAYLKVFPKKNSEGYHVEEINGKTVKQIFEDAKPYYCYETEDGITIDLGSLACLDFLGFAEPFLYKWSDGSHVIEETYTANDFVSWDEFVEIRSEYDTPSEAMDFVWYDVDEERSLAVLTLTECTYNQAYRDCVRAMFSEVKEKGIQTVAVDLRGNGGGSSLVGNEFIKYLPVDSYFDGPYDWRWNFLTFHNNGKTTNERYENLMFEGDVYILTDKGTFSAAKDFAMLIQDNHFGEIVGEPSANSVNGYGEITGFYLPNTGMFVQISTKKWYRIDSANTDDYVMPDYPCDSRECIEKLYDLVGASDNTGSE